MKKRNIVIKVSILIFLGIFISLSQVEASARFAIIFATGGLGDKSFNDSAMEGIKQAGKKFDIRYDYAEPKAIAEYYTYMSQFANTRKYDLIISIGFDQADALGQVASRFKKQKFAIIDMVVGKPNVASFIFKEEQRGFLMGYAAALMTTRKGDGKINRNKVIGVVGGMKVPLIDANIAGYIAGARYADPSVKVLHTYVGTWTDPAKGKELTISMIERSVDVVWGPAGRSGLGVINAAKERNCYAIGTDSNQDYLAPKHVLTNGMKYVSTTVVIAVEQVLQKSFSAKSHLLGVKEDALGYTRSILPEDLIVKLEEIKKKIIAGEIRIPSTIEAAIK